MFFDMPLEELERYRPERDEPADFWDFWQCTLDENKRFPIALELEIVDYGIDLFETLDVTFAGYKGQPVKAWFIKPKNTLKGLPCVVQYIGYGGGRGFPIDWLLWPSAGFATLVMDTRGQGGTWLQGDTPDLSEAGSSPHIPGSMTDGILQHDQYYYRRVFSDAVRALEAARNLPGVDPEKMVISGKSQGGGITLAVSGLDEHIQAVMADVPFLCHFKRAVAITDAAPYSEIGRYCKTHRDKTEQVFRTLSYFDGMNFVTRANAPALFSVGLMDTICPPSTIYGVFNHYHGEKTIHHYMFNEHDGGGSHHDLKKIAFMNKLFK
ncbi:MAG: acetylxylan esterase [Chloroflexi bacterium]|nr:acetylxylan esterase [Chloroflexota bacterium]